MVVDKLFPIRAKLTSPDEGIRYDMYAVHQPVHSSRMIDGVSYDTHIHMICIFIHVYEIHVILYIRTLYIYIHTYNNSSVNNGCVRMCALSSHVSILEVSLYTPFGVGT